MKKNLFIMVVLILIFLSLFSACDPLYPPGKLKVALVSPIQQGTTIDIEIIYPNTGGSLVFGWKDQNIEIISGNDIVSVSNLSLTGLKAGTATIKVNATTVISEEAIEQGHEERIYSTQIEIKVE